MSKIAISFEAVLSKKFEALCEQGESISISLGPLSGNKASGVIHLVAKQGVVPAALAAIGETSLIIRPSQSYQEAPDFPVHEGPGISNMFEVPEGDEIPPQVEQLVGKTNPDGKEGDPHPLTKVMEDRSRPSKDEIAAAVRELREKRIQEEQEAIAYLEAKKRGGVPRPQPQPAPTHLTQPSPAQPRQEAPFRPPKIASVPPSKPAALDSVMSYDEMVKTAERVQGVEKPIPVVPEGRRLSRSEAIKIEESIPRITKRAYVKNRLASELIIEDLIMGGQGINVRAFSIRGNGVCDLSRLPARSLLESGQLRWCFDKGYLVFVNYDEYMRGTSQVADLPHSSLPVFDSIEDAESGTGMAASGSSAARPVRSASVDESGEPVPGSLAMQCMEDGSAPEVPYEDSPDMDHLLNTLPKEKKAVQAAPSIRRTR